MHLTVQNLWMGPWKRVVEPCAIPHRKAVHGRRKSRPTPVDRPRIPPGGAVHSLWKGAAGGPRKAVRSPWKTRACTPEKLWIAGGKPAAKGENLCKKRRRSDGMGSPAPGLAHPGPAARGWEWKSRSKCCGTAYRSLCAGRSPAVDGSRKTAAAPPVAGPSRRPRLEDRWLRGRRRRPPLEDCGLRRSRRRPRSRGTPPAYWPARATACPLRISIMRWNLRALPSSSNDVTPAAPGKGFIAFM